MLAVVIGCVDQAVRDEANSAQPTANPGVSMYPLSTPPPLPVEAQPQYVAQPVPTPYTSPSPYATVYSTPYTAASPYTTTYAQPASAPLVFPDPPSVTLSPSEPTPYAASPRPTPMPYTTSPQPAPTPYAPPPQPGPRPYVSEPFAIPGDASPASSPYDNVIMAPPQPTPVIVAQPLPAATTYQAPITYPAPTYAQPTTTYAPPPATVYDPAMGAALPGDYRLVPATDIPPGNHPNDFLPSRWFEIIRPGDAPIRIGRVSSSCVCVGVRVPNRRIGQGERALIEARILTKPGRNNVTYGIFVNVAEPRAALLDADVTITW